MNILSVDNLTKSYGERILFSNIQFGLSQGDKFALIANNGTGKSTLLKIIAGNDVPDSGNVAIKKNIRIGYLPQTEEFSLDISIREIIHSEHSFVQKIINRYQNALHEHSNNQNAETQKELEETTILMENVDAWDYERKAETILNRFGLNDLEKTIFELSGGQKKRLSLAMVLLDNPELLILDEPTNHLDVDMIEWLEKYLQQQKITLLMVTHDRYFLDKVCNHILEMHNGKMYHHVGNYSYFLEKRAEREEVFRTEILKAKQLLKREQEWMRKMPKARSTKAKSRVDAFYDLKDKASVSLTKDEIKLEVKQQRLGGKILELKKVYKSYGDNLILSGFDYTFKKGEKIGIVGKNGVGKSTFLNIITGLEKPDSGKVNVGDTVTYGYYSQQGLTLKEDKRVIDVVKDIAEVIELANSSKLTASQFLQFFLFTPEMQFTLVSKLSGGEKRRLFLLTVLIKNPNFLILDEPTNDLDLLTLTKLEEFLLNFKGCVLIVSHDRYFMDVLVDHLFVFEGNGKIRDFNGNYNEYRILKIQEEEELKENTKQNEPNKTADNQSAYENKKTTYKEKLEFETLEKEIAQLEIEKQKMEEQISTESNYETLEKLSIEIGQIIQSIDQKTLRWMDLSEKM